MSKSIKSTSNKPTAIERATPVERKGLFPWVTGHGSLCSSPSRSVKFMSILCTGCRNLQKFNYNVFLLLSSEKKRSASLFLAHINCNETVIRIKETCSRLSSYIQVFQDNKSLQNKKKKSIKARHQELARRQSHIKNRKEVQMWVC